MTAKSTGSTLDTLTALRRDFPRWAMWRDGTGRWAATRTPGREKPSPGSCLLWVFGDTPEELVARMRDGQAMADSQWSEANRAIERLRTALATTCAVSPSAVSWSYGGAFNETYSARVSVRLDVRQTDDLAAAVARNNQPPT